MAKRRRKSHTVYRQILGLQTQYNPMAIQPGACLQADNVDFSREGVAGKRRGQKRYGPQLSQVASQLLEFKDRVVVHDGTALKYDSDGAGTAWTAWTGSFSAPDGDHRIRSIEDRLSLYFTSASGIYKNDALANSPVLAGMPKGFPPHIANLVHSSALPTERWMPPDTQIAYKYLYVRKDANGRTIRGAPSERTVVTNPKFSVTLDWSADTVTVTHTAHGYSTADSVTIFNSADAGYEGTFAITVTGANTYTYALTPSPADPSAVAAEAGRSMRVDIQAVVPEGLAAADKYEIYRTEVSASASTDPGDLYFLIQEQLLTQSQIDNRLTLLFNDIYDESFLGDELETNPTRETGNKEASRPPFARDLATYKNHTFFANTNQFHTFKLQLIFDDDQTGRTFKVSDGTTTITLTFQGTESIANLEPKTFNGNNSPTLTSAERIRKTMQSVATVISGNTTSKWYADYVSGALDPPGIIVIRSRNVNDPAFRVGEAHPAMAGHFLPAIPTGAVGGSSLISDNETKKNRLYRSKFDKPEAVPLLNFDDVGSEKFAILRILALRSALLIFKEEGIWRLSGESEASFTLTPLASEVRLLAPETAAIFEDSVYCLSNHGVIKVNEAGWVIVSRAIESELRKIPTFSGYKTKCHAVGYDSEHKYILWTPQDAADTKASVAWVYDSITEQWSRWKRPAKAARVLFTADRIFTAHPTDQFILRERKDIAESDYTDEDIAVTVTAVGTTTDEDGNTVSQATLTYTYGETLVAGFLFEQGGISMRMTVVEDLGGNSFRCQLEGLDNSLVTGAATVGIPVSVQIRWMPESLGDPTMRKHFIESQVYLEKTLGTRHKIGFLSDVVPEDDVKIMAVKEIVADAGTDGWGQNPWGTSEWGDPPKVGVTPLRSYVPRQMRRARTLSLFYRHEMAKESFNILVVGHTLRVLGEKSTMAPR